MLTTTLAEIALHTAVTVVRDATIHSLGFVTAASRGRLVFVEDPGWLPLATSSPDVAAVITSSAIGADVPAHLGLAIAEEPRERFYDIHEHLLQNTVFYGATSPSELSPSASVHPRAFVAPFGVIVGDRCVVEANATILPGVRLEDDAVVRAGAVVGSDGFQVYLRPGGIPRRIRHGGTVVLARGAEVRAVCCVDRALFGGATRIGEWSTIDHHAYVAHDVCIGARCRVGAGAILNGSSHLGDDVWIGPNATVTGGISVGDRAKVTLGSVVTLDVAADGHVSGNFAIEHSRFIQHMRDIR